MAAASQHTAAPLGQEDQTSVKKNMKSGVSSHWTMMILFFSLVLDLLGFTVILPLMPSLLEYYGRSDQVRTCVYMYIYTVLIL